MIAAMLTTLFSLAALAAIGVLADCGLRARAAVNMLRAERGRIQPQGSVRITVTSWRVAETGVAAMPARREVSPRRPAWRAQLAAAA